MTSIGNPPLCPEKVVYVCRKHSFSLCVCSPDGAHSDESTPDPSQAIYAEFDDDFEDEEIAAPIGKCTAMYNFPGMSLDGPCHVSARRCTSPDARMHRLMHVFHLAFGSVIQVPVKAPSLCRRGRYWLWWRRTKEMAGHVSVGTTATRATYRHLMSPFLLTSEDEEKRFTS